MDTFTNIDKQTDGSTYRGGAHLRTRTQKRLRKAIVLCLDDRSLFCLGLHESCLKAIKASASKKNLHCQLGQPESNRVSAVFYIQMIMDKYVKNQ